MDGSEDLPFCATTYDMDADNRWGFCKFQGNVAFFEYRWFVRHEDKREDGN